MKFIELTLVAQDGGIGEKAFYRPDKIVGVGPLRIPGKVQGPEGQPILVERAGLDLGYKVLPIAMTVDELMEVLIDVDG